MKTNSISAGLALHARTTATTRQLIFRRACLWTGLLAFATIAFGPPPAQAAVTEAWVQRYGSEAGSVDSASKVVTDAAGNVIVAGHMGNQAGMGDMLVIKYSGAGVPLWTNRYNGTGNGDAGTTAVAVDDNGNVFVTGSSAGSGGSDYATIAYSGAGVPLWTNRYNGSANGPDKASAVAVDASGNVFVTGSSSSFGTGADYATIAYSRAGVALWTNRYNGPANGQYDAASAVAVDASGNVFVTGISAGNGSDFDYATIAYSGAGVPLWTNRYNRPGWWGDEATAVAVDASGNVFVTGYSWVPDGFGESDSEYATIAYSGAGLPLWTNRYGGRGDTSDNLAHAVAVDGSGNVFVTGYSRGVGFDDAYATIAYSGAGLPLWTNRYGGRGDTSDNLAHAVAVDGSGNVFVTGYSRGVGFDDAYATIAYSGAGLPLWTNRYNGPGNGHDLARAVAVDGSGNVFVTGSSGDYCSFGCGGGDYATIAYSGAGVPLWTNLYNGSARALAVDASGNVFVTGWSGFLCTELGCGGGDYATIAYSGAGVPLWTNRYAGPPNSGNQPSALAVDASGNVFVTGSSVVSASDFDYATIAYSGACVPLWTNRYNGPYTEPYFANDQATAVAVDGSGNVFVTGYSLGSDYYDYATIAYSGAGVPLWTNRYHGPDGISDRATAVAVDGSGNVFVTGWSGYCDFGCSPDYYATIVYSSAGVPLWTNRYNGPSYVADLPQTKPSLAIGSDDAVYVTTSAGLSLPDFVTVKYVWRTEIAIQLLSTIPAKVNLTLSGAPNSSWAIERALEPAGPWTNLNALLIGPNGSAQFQDTNSPYPAGFYRIVQP